MAETANVNARDEQWRHPAFSRILLSGKAFVADVSGAIYWPAEATLIVSDLYLGREAELVPLDGQLPSDDVQVTVLRLRDAVRQYQPERVLVLGDSLPAATDTAARGVVDRQDVWEKLCELQSEIEWHWVADDVAAGVRDIAGGQVTEQFELGGMNFRARPVRAAVWHEIAGGCHPMAKISRQGRAVSSRCFVSSGTRLVMPAFGAQSGGVNVLDNRFSPIFSGETMFIWMIGWTEVYAVAARQLLED